MPVSRRLLVLAALLCLGVVLTGSTYGAPAPGFGGPRGAGSCGGFPFQLGSAHFVVHYFSDTTDTSCDTDKAINETKAGDALGWAERAYNEEIGTLGFPLPPNDAGLGGDNRWDIYIVDYTGTGIAGTANPDAMTTTTSGSINLDAKTGINPEVISHELFHIIQFGMWLPAQPDEYWLLESTAEWMSARINNFNESFVTDLGPPDMALDCKDPIGTGKCDLKDAYANGGYSRWPFWQSVTQLYGPLFVKDVFMHGQANPTETAVQALSAALSAHGTTLTDAFTNWTVQEMSGTYGLTQLDLQKPRSWKVISTGTTSQTLPAVDVPVNHLATRLLEFDRGDGTGGGTCFAAKLTLTVTIPQGLTTSKPSFYWNGLNDVPVPLAVNGQTATAVLPWDTCTWVGNQGFLNLPNPDTDPTHNGMLFRVVARIDVDTKTPGQAAAPPDPVKVTGPVVQTPSTVAPTIKAFGPELLRVSASSPVIRLIVQSSGEGTLRASLGGTALGNEDLRPGMNDVRFPLKSVVLQRLRTSSATGGNVLTLTPVSESGAVTGKAVTRKVLLPTKTTVKKVVTTTSVKKKPVRKHR